MGDMEDLSKWDEITIRTPGWRARPEQVADFLRAVFPEHVVLAFQQRVAEGAMRGAVKEFRDMASRKFDTATVPGEVAAKITETILSHFDPDHPEWGGKFPAKLLCPHHDTATQPAFYGMTPVMSECPGYPRCRAGMGIRETRR
jgi:hypothetical protein